MTLDIIQQNAKTIMEMYRLYATLQNQNDEFSKQKLKQIKSAILNLAYSIQKIINEERQNAS